MATGRPGIRGKGQEGRPIRWDAAFVCHPLPAVRKCVQREERGTPGYAAVTLAQTLPASCGLTVRPGRALLAYASAPHGAAVQYRAP